MAGTRTRSHARATGRVGPHTQLSAAGRARRHLRVRKKVSGSTSRPRLVVNRSARHMFAQIVDDSAGRTLAAASTLDAQIRGGEGDKTAKARQVGELLARRAQRPASRPWSSTGVATATTAGWPRWRTAPAKAA